MSDSALESPGGRTPDATPSDLPLSGVTVLDLSDEATAQGARMLAELGAAVVRVEHRAGDDLRTRPPFLAGPGGGEQEGVERALAHLLFNAGKRSLALDLDRAAAWGVVARLLPAVDVVIGPLSVRPAGRAFFAALRDAAGGGPGFVETVFRRGAPGPVGTDQVATDLIAMAAGGHVTLNGTPEEPPLYPAGQLGYRQASMTAAEAALALVHAARAGHPGGHVVVSLQEAVNFTTLQTANANFWHWRKELPSRHRRISSGAGYRSRDGKWTSFTVHPPNWFHFTRWVEETIGDTSLRDPKWESLQYRGRPPQGRRRGRAAALRGDRPGGAVSRGAGARPAGHADQRTRRPRRQRAPHRARLLPRRRGPRRRRDAAHAAHAVPVRQVGVALPPRARAGRAHGRGPGGARRAERVRDRGAVRGRHRGREPPGRGRAAAAAPSRSARRRAQRRRRSAAAADRRAHRRFHLGHRRDALHAAAGRPGGRRDQGGVGVPHRPDPLLGVQPARR